MENIVITKKVQQSYLSNDLWESVQGLIYKSQNIQ